MRHFILIPELRQPLSFCKKSASFTQNKIVLSLRCLHWQESPGRFQEVEQEISSSPSFQESVYKSHQSHSGYSEAADSCVAILRQPQGKADESDINS
ncbi:Rad51-Associated Protein 2 [Manis pentadactyla]|nr:Rad51-Associated Protein 2 [Manis pentadactyla]